MNLKKILKVNRNASSRKYNQTQVDKKKDKEDVYKQFSSIENGDSKMVKYNTGMHKNSDAKEFKTSKDKPNCLFVTTYDNRTYKLTYSTPVRLIQKFDEEFDLYNINISAAPQKKSKNKPPEFELTKFEEIKNN